jgi:outer membrane protein TolC
MWWFLFLPLLLFADFRIYEKEALERYESVLKSEWFYEQTRVKVQTLPQPMEAEIGVSDYGSKRLGRFEILWPLRLPGYSKALERIVQDRKKLLNLYREIERRKFIRQLETLYTDAVFLKKRVAVAQEEKEVQESIVRMLRQRVRNGFAKEVDFIKERQKLLEIEIKLKKLQNEFIASKLRLQSFAAIDKEPYIGDFLYRKFKKSEVIDWRTKVLEVKKMVALQEAKSVRNFDEINLILEYEEEPDRSITRAGLSLKLPFYKKNQRELKLLKVRKISLLMAKQRAAFSYALQELERSIEGLLKILPKQKELIRSGEELFKRYAFGFKNGSVTLLQLLEVKKALFTRKSAFIETEAKLNKKLIEYNALKKERK